MFKVKSDILTNSGISEASAFYMHSRNTILYKQRHLFWALSCGSAPNLEIPTQNQPFRNSSRSAFKSSHCLVWRCSSCSLLSRPCRLMVHNRPHNCLQRELIASLCVHVNASLHNWIYNTPSYSALCLHPLTLGSPFSGIITTIGAILHTW